MKTLILLLLVQLATLFYSNNPKNVVFFGDSITQAAIKPGGYISKIQEMLDAKGISEQYNLIGAGVSGNKVYDLYLRLEEDVLSHVPDIVFIYIGVNDVWHKNTSGTGTDADKFERFYQKLIDKLKARNAKVILCTPATIGERIDHSNAQDGDLNHYSNIIRALAEKNRLEIIDLRKEFLAYNLKNNRENAYKGILTTDGVHLNEEGNTLVAKLMFDRLN